MKTHLEDTNNNKKVKLDENGKINLSDIKTSVEFRIMKHREYIKKSEQTIIDNVVFAYSNHKIHRTKCSGGHFLHGLYQIQYNKLCLCKNNNSHNATSLILYPIL